MKQKRVLIFSTDDHLYPAGGAEQAFGNITARMTDVQFDLICAKLRPGVKKTETIGNVNIYRLGFGVPKLDGIILALFGHWYAKKLMRQHQYDLVWAIMASYGAFSAVRVKRKYQLPLVLTLQEGDSFDYIYSKVKFVRRSFNNIFKAANGLQAISNYLLAWGKDMGFSGTVGRVIPNGVDIEAFTHRYSEAEVREKRSSYNFAKDAHILFTSSRLEIKNGIGDVIEALSSLPDKVCFVVCGSGSLEEELKEKVTKLNLKDRVRFMGFVDPSELPLMMQAADTFIRPSLSEGLGNAFLEAMASGLVTVGTNAGGIPDFLEDGQTGFMVEAENPDSIAKTINKILGLSEIEKQAVLDRSYKMVTTTYDWDIVTKDMRDLFETVTDKS